MKYLIPAIISGLSQKELEAEMAKFLLEFDANSSDIECDIEDDDDILENDQVDNNLEHVPRYENNDEVEISEENIPEDDDDDTPLAELVPGARYLDPDNWKRSDQFREAPEYDPIEVGELEEPMVYFSRYLDEDFFVNMAQCMNIQEVITNGKSLNVDKKEIKSFWGISIIACLLGFPRLRMCWARKTRYPLIADNMTRDRFFKLRSRLKLVNENEISEEKKTDKFWKVRPMLEKVRGQCLKNVRPKNVSIDEQMIPFYGHVAMRQYIKGKPTPVGLKNFVVTSIDGIPLDFCMYAGKDSNFQTDFPVPDKLDVGGRVVCKLSSTLPDGSSIFMDRYFTSVPLLEFLLGRNMGGTGTIMLNRIPKTISFYSDSKMRKDGRGSHDQYVLGNRMAMVKWFDNRPIHVASTEVGSTPLDECKRWSKPNKKYIYIQRPALVRLYNSNMGGVDMLDRVISKYAMRVRTRKWTVRVIHHFFDFAIAAAWFQYRLVAKRNGLAKKQILSYYDYKLTVAEKLIYSDPLRSLHESSSEEEEENISPNKRRRVPQPLPPKNKVKESCLHMPENTSSSQESRSRCRFPGCKQFTFVKCTTCKVYLCFTNNRNCFKNFHA